MGRVTSHRRRPRPTQRLLGAAIGAALLLMAGVAVVSSHYTGPFSGSTARGNGQAVGILIPAPSSSTPLTLQTNHVGQHAGQHSNLFPYILAGLLAAMFLLGAIIVVAYLVALIQLLSERWRSWFARLRHDEVPTLDPDLPPVLDSLTAAIDEHTSTIDLAPPRNAIIAAWVALEDAVARAGVTPRASETSSELVGRVMDELDADGGAALELARLYRLARFSSHPVREADRARAKQLLETIRASLPTTEAAP